MTWEFITKSVSSAHAVSWEWEWRCTDPATGATRSSARTFASFRDCLRDARLHGFTGNADPGDAGTTVFHRPEFRFRWY